MGRFVNKSTGVTFSVDDSKDERYAGELFESADAPAPKKTTAKKASSAKQD